MDTNDYIESEYLKCLNCNYPFSGNEVFCPECGQKNKKNRLSFKNFINEIFKGFTSWDSKFWKTIIPLLTQPGKVSKDYVEGKRAKYTNPFRFYLTVSVIFFLFVGIKQKYTNYQEEYNSKKLQENSLVNTTSTDTIIIDTSNPSLPKKEFSINLRSLDKLEKMVAFYYKNPTTLTDDALDSLSYNKTFYNRFLYSRGKILYKITKNNNAIKLYEKKIISNYPIALFILLPVFSLFLKLVYFRGKKRYMEHLVFTFHTQTIWFIFLLFFEILFLFNFILAKNNYAFFIVPFFIYLFFAMRKFYEQSLIKTFLKLIFITSIFTCLLAVTTISILFITFILY